LKLFEPGKIGKLSIKNRIVMAAMNHGMAEQGIMSQQGIEYFIARARGGVGLITTNATGVLRETENEPASPGMTTIDSGLNLDWLSQLIEGVHNCGVKIAVQLWPDPAAITTVARRHGSAATTALPGHADHTSTISAITIEDIERFSQATGAAAEIAKNVGADAVEINAHGGHLVDEFMTALWNNRTDKYGGGLDGRLRFLLDMIQATRERAGADFPIIVKYAVEHNLKRAREIEEGLEIARRLEAAGVDALCIDAGCLAVAELSPPPTTMPPGLWLHLAEMVKKVINIPVITVGKLGYPELAENALKEGKTDFIGLGRALIADPEWANKVKEGRWQDIRPCVASNELCMGKLMGGDHLSCAVNPEAGNEREYALKTAERVKSVLVVGGGPGGMEAARVAALRGHKVTLWEKGDTLGGNLIPATVLDVKQDYRLLLNYLSTQITKLGVKIKLATEGTPELVHEMKPEVVLIATGSTPMIPAIQGVNNGKVVNAIDLLLDKREAGESVIVVGGGNVGVETALYLAQKSKKVTIVEILDSVLGDLQPQSREHLLKLLADADVEVLTNTNILEITDEGIAIADKDGKRSILEADTVTLAVGFKPDDGLFKALDKKMPAVYNIGDSAEPRKVMNAIWEGFHTARKI
jgi:2-enoate reductase